MYCAWRIPAHLRCTQCSILLHLMDICFLTCICLWQISQIQTFLRTPPPHTSSSEERLRRLTRRTLAQIRTDKSYLHKVDAKTHPSPLCPLCNIHTHDTHHLFNCTHIGTTLSPLDLWTDPAGVTTLLTRWTEKLAGGPQAGTSDSPTSKGHGSG